MTGTVAAVCRSATHSFTKPNADSIRLLAGLGVDGDAHQGATVQHRSRIERFGGTPNLRQVHLIHAELFDELRAAGFAVSAGEMGENASGGIPEHRRSRPTFRRRRAGSQTVSP